MKNIILRFAECDYRCGFHENNHTPPSGVFFMGKENFKDILGRLSANALTVNTGRVIGRNLEAQTLDTDTDIVTLSAPDTRWAVRVDGIEAPFAPDYDTEEYGNFALNAMGIFELMEMLEAFGVPKSKQIDYRAQPLADKSFIVTGCGTGREVVALSALGAKVTGFDATKTYAGLTRSKITDLERLGYSPEVTLYQALAERFPYSEYQADGITSLFGVINHVELWEQTLKNMNSGLKDDGILVIEKYGPNKALIFNELRNGLPYQPSILQRRTEGGILLGENATDVLPAVFPNDSEFSQALSDAGFRIARRQGFLRLAALYPKDPSKENIRLFMEKIESLDPKAFRFISQFTKPSDLLYAAMLYDRMFLRQNPDTIDEFAYSLYVCEKNIYL